jgi:hypothetical protein
LQHKTIIMKKLILLFTIGVMTSEVKAQLSSATLSGTSYTQDFDGLASGLPSGWHVFTEASATDLGRYWDTSATKWLMTPSATGSTRTNWNSTTGNFRNVASADAGTSTLDSLGQLAATDRALGIRQVGATNAAFPNSDSGAAFALQIANTLHRGDFALTFKLQSLDETSPRVTTWVVDYGVGADPTTFTSVTTTGIMTTGGSSFTNNTITVDFGTALDSLAGPVWIRVVALDGTTGSGNRTTTAIDDFALTYYSSPAASVYEVNNKPLAFFVAGAATTNNIILGGLEKGKYSVAIVDMVGRTVYNSNANVSGQQVAITDANLQSGLYVMKVSNGHQSGVVKVNIQ